MVHNIEGASILRLFLDRFVFINLYTDYFGRAWIYNVDLDRSGRSLHMAVK